MTEKKSNNKEEFVQRFREFLSVAVGGKITCAFLYSDVRMKEGAFRLLSENLNLNLDSWRDYVNHCYHSYHRRDDPYVMKTFEELFAYNVIKGSRCMFETCFFIGCDMLIRTLDRKAVQTTDIEDADKAREIIFKLFADAFDVSMEGKVLGAGCIGDQCQHMYDGSDILPVVRQTRPPHISSS